MDINILNSGTPNSKPWLNIVCDTLTCNEIITPPQPSQVDVFSLVTSFGSTALPAITTTPCDTVLIANPNVDLLTNTYTATRDCFMYVSFSTVVSIATTNTSADSSVIILINGAFTTLRSRDLLVFPLPNGSAQIGVYGILRLSVGDVLSVQFSNAFVGGGFSYELCTFCGFIIN